jgi:hypothetical protein
MLLSLLPDGPLPRLLAPGIPDWIGADGTRFGWSVRDRLFIVDGDFVRLVKLPAEVLEVAATPGAWVVALPNGCVTVDPAAGTPVALLLDDEAMPVEVRPGERACLFVEVPEHRLLRLASGDAVALPDAATRAKHIRPWASGEGACWVDLDTLYRMREGGSIAALGKAPGAEGIGVGPRGAVVVSLKADTVVAAPRGLALRLGERVDAESARFSADGTKALVATERGVAEVDLIVGSVGRRWEGDLAPVGYASIGGEARALVWDTAAGVVRDDSGVVRLRGVAGATPGAGAGLLAGPGGALWRLADGACLREDLGEGACAVTEGTVAQVRAEDVRWIDLGTGAERVASHTLCEDDDAIEAAWFHEGALCALTLEGTRARWASPGAEPSRTHAPHDEAPGIPLPDGVSLSEPDEDSCVTLGAHAWPVPADGAVAVDDALYAFTDDGMLTRLR